MADQGKARDPVWPSTASLVLLGPVRLRNSAGDDETPKTRKTRALLAILALAEAPVPRARLCDLLWGDRGEEQAKASLRQALYELRTLADTGSIAADRQSVALPAATLPTDVAELDRRLARNDFAGIASALEQVQLPLLAGLDDLTPELDDWLRDERSRLCNLILKQAVEAAEAALAAADAGTAQRISNSLERIDPLGERAVQAGVRADLALADQPAAHRRVARFERQLRDELGLKPSLATRALLKEAPAAPEPRVGPNAEIEQSVGGPLRRRWMLWILLAALLLGAGAFYFLRSKPAEANPTIAVLPFEEVGQKTQGYFASGVSDEILNLLSHEQRIRVLGRVSAAEIADRPNSLEVARNLGITHLLDGSVRTAGDRVLVIVTLTRVADGSQMWSERYERRLGDIFAVQGDIASTVASRLSRSFGKPIARATSPQVYDRYLAARQLIRERREVTLLEADRLLREAIRLDPNYAPAYAELAQVLMLRSDHPTSYGSIPVDRARAEALQLARKAIQLDPGLGDAYAAMGFVDLQDKKSAPYYRKAVELSPQRPEYHRWLATSLNRQFRYDESINQYRRAIEIDPLWYINYEHLAGALLYLGRDEEARQAVRRFLDLSTDERAKMLLLEGYSKNSFEMAGYVRYSRALYMRFPEERNMRFNYASALAALGDNRQAAALMQYDPLANSLLRSNWSALASEATRQGRNFWDRSDLWGTATLLVASGHSAELVRLYDQAQPFIQSGSIDMDYVAVPATILALRHAGRRAEADRLLQIFTDHGAKFPESGLGGLQKEVNFAFIAALAGRNEEAISLLDRISKQAPLALNSIPSVSLLNIPYLNGIRGDPRLATIDERLRMAVNAERLKVGLPSIGREAWLSDPRTLLTKN